MSTELETAKLFANYFDESEGQSNAVAEGDANATTRSAPTTSQQESFGFEATKWPGAMTIVTTFFYILGVSGVIGGLFAMRGLANLEAAEILMSKMAAMNEDAAMASAALAAQVKYSSYLYLNLGFRILCGCACFGVASLLTKRFEGANNIAVLTCGLLIFYNMCNLGVTYLTTSAIGDIPGVNADAMSMGMTIAIAIAGIGFLIKMGIYCGLAYYLTRPAIDAIFAPKPKRKRGLSY